MALRSTSTAKAIAAGRGHATCAVLAWALLMPIAQAQVVVPPELTTPPTLIEVAEGNTGTTPVVLTFTLNAPSLTDVSFDLAVEWQEWNAVPGADFSPFPARTVSIPAGQTVATVSLDIFGDTHTEQNQDFRVTTGNLVGATYEMYSGNGTTIRILEDDVDDITDWVAIDDEFYVVPNVPSTQLVLDLNDQVHRDWYDYVNLTFEMIGAPAHGSFEYDGGGRGEYTLEPGFLGTDVFYYRLCIGATCREAKATINVVPFEWQRVGGDAHSGYREVPAHDVEGRLLAATPLVSPVIVPMAVDVDRSPQNPWNADGGVASHVVVVPAWSPGEPRERVARVEVQGSGRLFVGVDTNGDGRLVRSESLCTGASSVCLLPYSVGDAPGAWIVRLHNPFEFSMPATVSIHDIPVSGPDGSLTATGPGRQTGWPFEDVHLGWNDPELVGDDLHAGLVRVTDMEGAKLVDVPVDVLRWSNAGSLPIPLVSGRAQTLRLAASMQQPKTFIDVPAGAQRLRVVVAGGGPEGTEFYVARQSTAVNAAVSTVDPAPEASQAAATGSTVIADGTVLVEGNALAPGRWYIVPVNGDDAPVALTVTATVEALAPVVRAGSYFNPAQAGSGVFLYPAADQWTGVWYTYFADGRPTWYYLQGIAPGENGLWHSPIYRATWHGTTRTLTEVGEATVTPTAADAFTMTYTIDGVTGSQPLQSLGRGCPTQGGVPVDISSTWFDPAKDGTGYSVQMWGNYEFYAAFNFDEQGVPMFLLAEQAQFAGNEATFALERLVGSCPTCEWRASTRTQVGTFVRRLVNNTLTGIELDAVWQDGNPPFWLPPVSSLSTEDSVQLLGGSGTTQGCAL